MKNPQDITQSKFCTVCCSRPAVLQMQVRLSLTILCCAGSLVQGGQ